MSTSTLQENVGLSARKSSAPAPAPQPMTRQALIQRYKRPALIAAAVLAAVTLAFYGYDSFTHEETDDAYVTGHLHEVSARNNGVVTEVLVNDNQKVEAGQVLVKLDPATYEALVLVTKASLTKAQADLSRQEPLQDLHAVSNEQIDATKATRDEDAAQLGLAQLQVQYCTIVAPAAGYVGRKNVEEGNRITSGQTLMVVVDPHLWIEANFKETQLAHMQRNQRVKITIDAIPGKVFAGVVNSFSPASGNEFALLPADNSTGNFTKIVQRVPVKIVFNPDSMRGYEERIRAGESVVVKVDLDAHPQPVSWN